MKLLVQPGRASHPDRGHRARKSIDIAIFRFDLPELEKR
jgi:hypothetical protein